MTWADFDADTTLERDVLRRALPLAETVSTGRSRATVDLVTNAVAIAVGVQDTVGPTPSGCVDLLQIRPLLTGTAWKVLDMLFETALDLARQTPDRGRRWSIGKKLAHARARTGRPSLFSSSVWEPLMATYVETADLRDSLVHRRVYTDPSGALIGIDRSGTSLRPLTATEQEALGRTALRAAELVLAPIPDSRVTADLTRQLGYLRSLHRMPVPAVTVVDSLPEITVIIEADPAFPDQYLLDLPALRAWQPFRSGAHADLVVRLRDRPGLELRGRLEDAPDEIVSLNPVAPPPWLD